MPTHGRRIIRIAVLVATVGAVVAQGMGSASAVTQVGLGLAEPFAVLAGTPMVDNTGLTVVSGDLGIAPAAAVNGFGGPPSGTVINGAIHAADVPAGDAKAALTNAYLDAVGRADTAPVLGAALDGLDLPAGVYSGGALGLAAGGTLTLNGHGDPDAVFIFRASSTLITMAGSTVLLTGQAQACNVFWQVTSSATLGTNSTFVGTVMALADIQAQTGANIQGRLLARNGQVTLDANHITKPTCAAPAVVVPPVVVPGFVFVPTPTTAPTTTTTAPPTTTSTTTPTTTPSTTTTTAPGTTSTTLPTATATATSPVTTPTAGTGPAGGDLAAGLHPRTAASGAGRARSTSASSSVVSAASTPGPATPAGSSTGTSSRTVTSQPELPRTGSDVGTLTLFATFAMCGGATLIGASRRRQPVHARRR